jgi:hypothetical protein
MFFTTILNSLAAHLKKPAYRDSKRSEVKHRCIDYLPFALQNHVAHYVVDNEAQQQQVAAAVNPRAD